MFDCCENLITSIQRNEFRIYPQFRGVCYYIWDEVDKKYGEYFMRYCPFCGAKMPKILYGIDENGNSPYSDALEEALGKDFCDIKPEEIPEEFKTDEWWKKRGL